MPVACQREERGSGVHRSSMNCTPPPSLLLSLSFASLYRHDFDVALLVMPYFSWLLNPNGKFNVTKFSLLPKCTDLTFYATLKR